MNTGSNTGVLPGTDLSVRSCGDLLQALQQGQISAPEIAEMCIARQAQVEDKILAWEAFSPELLRSQAAAAQVEIERRRQQGLPLRLLEGLPVGVKDTFNTSDFPTQMGSPLWQGFTPGNDARPVFHLKRQGAIVPGKTVTAEFAVHALGKTQNPHHPLHNPGTSSSGSAAAVAAGVVPLAIGTQTAGSIVRPASYCGIYGCKPSFGLIPRTGMLKTTDSLDTVGFFVAHAADLERGWQTLRVSGADYPLAEKVFADPGRNSKPARPWKIGVVRTHTWQYAQDYAQQALFEFAQKLGQNSGYQVEEVTLPASVANAHQVHATIYDRTLHYYFQEEYKRAELVSPVMLGIMERGKEIALADFRAALLAQEQIIRDMDQFLSQYDAVLSLSTSGQAPLRDEDEKPDPALIWTLCHLPVVSSPAFVSPQGLPFGMQVLARKYNDLQLFALIQDLVGDGLLPQRQQPLVGY